MRTIDRINSEHFENRLHRHALRLFHQLDEEPEETRRVIEHVFAAMASADIGASDISELVTLMIAGAATVAPAYWGGRVPSVTMSGRHELIDRYIASNQWRSDDTGTLLDVGCGFPPLTSLETGERLWGWHIVAADPAITPYAVYDVHGDYACVNDEGEVTYFQAGPDTFDNWGRLLADPDATRKRFKDLFEALRPSSDTRRNAIESDEGTLVLRPFDYFSSKNVRLVEAGIGDVDIEPVDVVRIFNVLNFFPIEFRRSALEWAGSLLRKDGLLITGSNWRRGRNTCYRVRQKENGRLADREFSFSLDSLRPFGVLNFVTFDEPDDDATLMIRVVRAIRSDADFWPSLSQRLDEIAETLGLCARDGDGYLRVLDRRLGASAVDDAVATLVQTLDSEGFTAGAVDALTRAGFLAWRNEVGLLSLSPENSANI